MTLKRGMELQTIYGEKTMVQNKADLINFIIKLEVGESFDWWEFESDDECGIGYTVEKMSWADSLIVLIGGYGGDVMCADLTSDLAGDKEYWIEDLVNKFFKLRFIGDDEMIAVAHN